MRARPRRGSTSSWDGKFGATKALGPSPIESLLERDFQTLLTANPRIKSYGVQCHRLTYWAPETTGRQMKRTYTPDIVALGLDGRIVIMEVKALAFQQAPAWQRVEPSIREAYAVDHGVSFQVFTEKEIRSQPRLANCEEMLRFRAVDHEADGIIRRLVANGRFTTLGDLLTDAVEGGLDDNRSYAALMRSLMSGDLSIDLSFPLSAGSPAWAPVSA